ncbi:hypothetical protein [Arenibaculum pallidiluteum]|uniref:hypothetical protein n=1 Tax=Arenibaculum pallidiluteum TaxID=2812559 RepID=UPI001A96662D|nr:hypothetical protein [Arenibaculum pallidiluteum]
MRLLRLAMTPLLAAGVLVAVPSDGSAKGACPPAPDEPTVAFRPREASPEIIERLPRAEIQRIARRDPGIRTRGGHVNGLTQAEFALKISGSVTAVRLPQGGFCVYPGRLEVEYGYPTTRVYLPREYGADGMECAREAVREHELTHVRFNQETLERHGPRIEEAARRAVDEVSAGIVARSVDAGGRRIYERVASVAGKAVKAMERERNALHAGIDTADSYRQTTARCAQW